jgi:formate dehydrogenase major subunit
LTSGTFGSQSSNHPALDPFGKIPEFKYCAARVEPAAEMPREAAE